MSKTKKIFSIVCDACGKECSYNRSFNGKKYCYKHYAQIRKYGYVLDNNPRGKYDRNEYRIVEDKVIFDTYNTHNLKNGEFIIDLEDLDKVKDYKWNIRDGYVLSKVGQNKIIHLSRLLLNLKEEYSYNGVVVDHIDGNTLNNSKSNLRICSRSENQINQHKTTTIASSGFIGTRYDKRRKTYQAMITLNKKTVYLHYSYSLKEVVYARYIAEKLIYGEYAEQKEHCRKYEFTKDLSNETKEDIENKVKYKLKQKFIIHLEN